MKSLLHRPGLLRKQAFVAGEWVDGSGLLPVIDPATGQVIAEVAIVGRAETRHAIEAAEASRREWQARTAKERAVILRRWSDFMHSHLDDLASIMTAEQGKPLPEARGEIAYAASFLEWYAEEGRRIYGEIIPPHQQDKRLLVFRQPIGVCAAITPWNFPAAMITRKAGPALAAGCGLVIKPSELTPLTALALCVLAEEAGIPAGLVSCLVGDAEEIGAELTSNPLVRKLSFTGSTHVGRKLMAACSKNITRVSLELGGNAPFLVFDDADLDDAVEGVIASKFRNAGQTCVCANRIYVQSGVYSRFVELLAAAVRKLRTGAGTGPDVDIGPLIDDRAVKKVRSHVEDALARGARLVVPGGETEGGGTFFSPVMVTDVPHDALVSREETFGPLAAIFRFETEEEGLRLANDTPSGLAAYFYARDYARIFRVAEALEYGIVGHNTGIISTEVAPFGGIKESGIGREGSHMGMDDYLEVKYLCMGGIQTAATAETVSRSKRR